MIDLDRREAVVPMTGRTAAVTGASRGIGLAIARAFAGAGARVAMLARGADDVQARAREIGDRAVAIVCDVGERAQVVRAAGELRELFRGAPDILVNNAGIFSLAPVDQTEL